MNILDPLLNWYDFNLLAGNLEKYRTMNNGHGEDKKRSQSV